MMSFSQYHIQLIKILHIFATPKLLGGTMVETCCKKTTIVSKHVISFSFLHINMAKL